eukprot:scaffold1878_cov355-Prasinococcus_capsulatus_cf.AAC.2
MSGSSNPESARMGSLITVSMRPEYSICNPLSTNGVSTSTCSSVPVFVIWTKTVSDIGGDGGGAERASTATTPQQDAHQEQAPGRWRELDDTGLCAQGSGLGTYCIRL